MANFSARHPYAGVCFTVAAASGFALSLVMARLSYEHGSDPPSVMLLRFVAMFVALVVWNRWRGRSLRLQGSELRGSVLCGLLYFGGIFSYLSSVAWLPVSLSVLIFYTFPILVALASALFLAQPLNRLGGLALMLAFAGLLLALDVDTGGVSAVGLGFAVFAAVAVAANLILSGQLLQRVPAPVFGCYTAAVCACMAGMVVLGGGGLQLPQGAVGWGVFGTMLAAFFIGFISSFNAISHIGSMRFAALMNLEPVATVLFAIAILGEQLSALQAVGAGVVIGGVLLSQCAAHRS